MALVDYNSDEEEDNVVSVPSDNTATVSSTSTRQLAAVHNDDQDGDDDEDDEFDPKDAFGINKLNQEEQQSKMASTGKDNNVALAASAPAAAVHSAPQVLINVSLYHALLI